MLKYCSNFQAIFVSDLKILKICQEKRFKELGTVGAVEWEVCLVFFYPEVSHISELVCQKWSHLKFELRPGADFDDFWVSMSTPTSTPKTTPKTTPTSMMTTTTTTTTPTRPQRNRFFRLGDNSLLLVGFFTNLIFTKRVTANCEIGNKFSNALGLVGLFQDKAYWAYLKQRSKAFIILYSFFECADTRHNSEELCQVIIVRSRSWTQHLWIQSCSPIDLAQE